MTDLREAEQAHAAAVAAADAALEAYKLNRSAKAFTDAQVKKDMAEDAKAAVAVARAAAEKARRAEISKKLADARARASRDRLFADTAQARARLLDIFASALPIVREIEAAVHAQNEAAAEAKELAAELGEYPDVDEPVSKDLLRAMTCVALGQWLVDENVRVEHGRGPWRYLEPRWDRGVAAPDHGLIREARALAVPADAYMPTASVDFTQAAADVAPWEVTPADRPQRYEVT